MVLLLFRFFLNKALFADHVRQYEKGKAIKRLCRVLRRKSRKSCAVFLLFKFNVLYVDVKLLEPGVLLDRIKAVSGKKSCTQSRV